MTIRAVMAGVILLPALLCAHQAHPRGGQKSVGVVRDFVQGFYNWYVPEVLKTQSEPVWSVALKYRRNTFSPVLFQALKEDAAAQAKASSEIVGLDFDPFLNTQDPCDRYEIGTVTRSKSRYLVDIYGVCSGKRNERPDAVAELASQNSSWVFVNFRYPALGTNLLSVLKALRKERQRTSG